MPLKIAADGGTTRLILDGRLDAAGCEKVETQFTAATSSAQGNILVDLTGVDYIGSLGIRLLISGARTVRRRGNRMVIIGAQAQPSDVFETVALADLIPIAGSESEAKGLLAGG